MVSVDAGRKEDTQEVLRVKIVRIPTQDHEREFVCVSIFEHGTPLHFAKLDGYPDIGKLLLHRLRDDFGVGRLDSEAQFKVGHAFTTRESGCGKKRRRTLRIKLERTLRVLARALDSRWQDSASPRIDSVQQIIHNSLPIYRHCHCLSHSPVCKRCIGERVHG